MSAGKHSKSLGADELAEVRENVEAGIEALGLKGNESPKEIAKKIYEFVQELKSLKEGIDQDDALDDAIMFGCLWGEMIVREAGWRWADVKSGNEYYCGVISRDDNFAALPMYLFQEYIENAGKDNTSLLVFNMIAANKLPPAKESECVVLW